MLKVKLDQSACLHPECSCYMLLDVISFITGRGILNSPKVCTKRKQAAEEVPLSIVIKNQLERVSLTINLIWFVFLVFLRTACKPHAHMSRLESRVWQPVSMSAVWASCLLRVSCETLTTCRAG